MTDKPTSQTVHATQSVAKKATRTRKTAAKKAAPSPSPTPPRDDDDPRPLKGHAGILVSYAALSGILTVAFRRKGLRNKAWGPMDLLLYGLATEHLSRVITKDTVTSPLRTPFARFKEPAGEGEVNEEVIGDGARHAVGELLTCPFCMAQWVATCLVAGSAIAPGLTTAVVSVSAAARASDYLDLLYGILRNRQ